MRTIVTRARPPSARSPSVHAPSCANPYFVAEVRPSYRAIVSGSLVGPTRRGSTPPAIPEACGRPGYHYAAGRRATPRRIVTEPRATRAMRRWGERRATLRRGAVASGTAGRRLHRYLPPPAMGVRLAPAAPQPRLGRLGTSLVPRAGPERARPRPAAPVACGDEEESQSSRPGSRPSRAGSGQVPRFGCNWLTHTDPAFWRARGAAQPNSRPNVLCR